MITPHNYRTEEGEGVTDFLGAEIERREDCGKRLASRYAHLPSGMAFTEFLLHPEIADLNLDFITASTMYDAYAGTSA